MISIPRKFPGLRIPYNYGEVVEKYTKENPKEIESFGPRG
jgi:hypothetical protein